MTNLRAGKSGEHRDVPGAIRSLVTITYSELRQDTARLFASNWADPERRRLMELATALGEACEREGLVDLAAPARTMARLARVPRVDALLLRKELQAKFEELLSLAQRMISAGFRRSTA